MVYSRVDIGEDGKEEHLERWAEISESFRFMTRGMEIDHLLRAPLRSAAREEDYLRSVC